MLADIKLSRFLQTKTLNTATYVKNRLSYKKLERGTTPYEAFYDTKPFIEHLQPFERKCFMHISLKQRKAGSKLMLRAKIDHFVKYNSVINKIYYIYISSEHKVVEMR